MAQLRGHQAVIEDGHGVYPEGVIQLWKGIRRWVGQVEMLPESGFDVGRQLNPVLHRYVPPACPSRFVNEPNRIRCRCAHEPVLARSGGVRKFANAIKDDCRHELIVSSWSFRARQRQRWDGDPTHDAQVARRVYLAPPN